jgi:hypothetical protein
MRSHQETHVQLLKHGHVHCWSTTLQGYCHNHGVAKNLKRQQHFTNFFDLLLCSAADHLTWLIVCSTDTANS